VFPADHGAEQLFERQEDVTRGATLLGAPWPQYSAATGGLRRSARLVHLQVSGLVGEARHPDIPAIKLSSYPDMGVVSGAEEGGGTTGSSRTCRSEF